MAYVAFGWTKKNAYACFEATNKMIQEDKPPPIIFCEGAARQTVAQQSDPPKCKKRCSEGSSFTGLWESLVEIAMGSSRWRAQGLERGIEAANDVQTSGSFRIHPLATVL